MLTQGKGQEGCMQCLLCIGLQDKQLVKNSRHTSLYQEAFTFAPLNICYLKSHAVNMACRLKVDHKALVIWPLSNYNAACKVYCRCNMAHT